ncbi:MAG: ribose-phosphate pyrophosphokinase-like domain-containing protein, partial [Acidimicrobiales bacterium]
MPPVPPVPAVPAVPAVPTDAVPAVPALPALPTDALPTDAVPRRSVTAVVLAAGEGKRMRSPLPKPLQALGGRPMIAHVLDAIAGLGSRPLHVVVVVGHGADQVTRAVTSLENPGLVLHFAEQSARRGTGDAVTAALAAQAQLLKDGDVLVLPADTPLLRPVTLEALVATHHDTRAAATVLTARLEDPTGYGRVVRDTQGEIASIVEQADTTPAQAAIHEVNTGVYCFDAPALAPALAQLDDANAQGERYLTDTLAILRTAGQTIASVQVEDPIEVAGVNDADQLAAVEAALRYRRPAMELVSKKRLELYAGRSHPALASAIAAHLGVTLGNANLRELPDSEFHCQFGESVRGADLFVFQTHARRVNDSIMEQCILIDAAKRASARRITAVCPYFGYSRQDRKA